MVTSEIISIFHEVYHLSTFFIVGFWEIAHLPLP